MKLGDRILRVLCVLPLPLARPDFDHRCLIKYLEELRSYTASLVTETETIRLANDFIETTTIDPNYEGTLVYTEHKRRDLEGTSYQIAQASVQGTADMQIAIATGMFMRIIDNISYEYCA